MAASARLIIFCGKGGVGKTTLSLAAGLRHAIDGHRVLIVTSHRLTDLALAVSLEGLSARFPSAAPNLFIVYIDPWDLIAELVKRNFPVPMMAQKLLQSSVFRNLIEVAPGLKEFFLLGRMQELAERRSGDSTSAGSQYDYLIWDAPASGHFLSTLRSARNFGTFLTGPLAVAGAQLHRFFSSPGNIQLFPVTLLEEMAIAETLETSAAMAKDFQISSSAVLVNCVSPMCGKTEFEMAELETVRESSPAMHFAFDRGRKERKRRAELSASLPVAQVLVPRITQWSSDLDLLARIGERMDISRFS